MIAALAALILCVSCACAGAEETGALVMAGFDDRSSGHDWANNLFFVEMEKRTGLHFAFQRYDDAKMYDSWKAGLTAGGDLPDVLFKAALTEQETLRLYEAGVLIDLRPLLEENAPNLSALLREHPDWAREITLPDGAVAALPLLDPLQNNNLIWINRTWLTLCRKEMPTDAASLADVLRAFRTMDPNRNGRDDEVPLTFTGLWDLRFLQHAFGLVLNDYYLCADEAGRVTCGLTDPRCRAWLEWLHGLWEEGLLDRFGFSTPDTMRRITDTEAAIPYGVIFGPSPLQLLPSGSAEHYELLQPLVWEGTQSYRSLLGAVTKGTFAVTSACKDPAAVLRWVDLLYSEEGCFLAHAGLEGRDWERLSDGSWSWLMDANEVMNTVLTEDTIADGGPAPGYVPVSYQINFDDAATRRTVSAVSDFSVHVREPMPQVCLTAAEDARLAEIWPAIQRMAETRMTWFITGDQPLNDETWNAFCEELDSLGMPEAVRIWQGAMDR